jgi:TPP-dependent pyruvate/acetoin dehydrogenase alpha subunit
MATKVREQIAIATPNSGHPNPLISHEKLQQLYSMMLQCRLLEERAQNLRDRAGFSPSHDSSTGLEAMAVGTAIHLKSADTLAPLHCDFLLTYLKGVSLSDMISQFHWRKTRVHPGGSPLNDFACGSFNIVLPIPNLDAQLKKCNDIALINQRKKNDNVAIAFVGEGSTAPSVWHDALTFAGRRGLPIVFVRHSNISTAVRWEGIGPTSSAETVGYGFPEIAVDGKDAVAMYRVAQEAIERARSGGGPTLIEAQTFPERRPTAIDRAQPGTNDDVGKWESSDPIAFMERYLTGKDLFSAGWKDEIIAAFHQELDAAVYEAEIDSCGASA